MPRAARHRVPESLSVAVGTVAARRRCRVVVRYRGGCSSLSRHIIEARSGHYEYVESIKQQNTQYYAVGRNSGGRAQATHTYVARPMESRKLKGVSCPGTMPTNSYPYRR